MEQFWTVALALSAEKRNPVMEIVLKGTEANAAAAINETLSVTSVAPTKYLDIVMLPPVPVVINIAGNSKAPCVCNGHPSALNVDTLTLAAAAAAAGFVNPATMHTTAAIGNAGAAEVDMFSSSTPEDGVKAAETATFDGWRLEHVDVDELLLKEIKRRPVTETILKVTELGSTKEMNSDVSTAGGTLKSTPDIWRPHILGLSLTPFSANNPPYNPLIMILLVSVMG